LASVHPNLWGRLDAGPSDKGIGTYGFLFLITHNHSGSPSDVAAAVALLLWFHNRNLFSGSIRADTHSSYPTLHGPLPSFKAAVTTRNLAAQTTRGKPKKSH
jgi:hypothetical protein